MVIFSIFKGEWGEFLILDIQTIESFVHLNFCTISKRNWLKLTT